jgi:hypothetical protein
MRELPNESGFTRRHELYIFNRIQAIDGSIDIVGGPIISLERFWQRKLCLLCSVV